MTYNEFIDKYGINIEIQNIVVNTSLLNNIIKDKYNLLDSYINVFISFIDSNNNFQYKKVSISIFDLDKLFNRKAIKKIFKSIEMKNKNRVPNNDIFIEAFEIIEKKLNFLDKILKNGIKSIDDIDKLSIILSNRSKSSNIEKNSSSLILKFNNLKRFLLVDELIAYNKLKLFINENKNNSYYTVNDYKEYLKTEINIENDYLFDYFSFDKNDILIINKDIKYTINSSNMEKILKIIIKNVENSNKDNILKIYNEYIIKSDFLQILNSIKIENEMDFKNFLKMYDVDVEYLNMTKTINNLVDFFKIVGNKDTIYQNITLYNYLAKISTNFLYFKNFEKLLNKESNNINILSI